MEFTYPVTYKVSTGATTISKINRLKPVTKVFEVYDRMVAGEFLPAISDHFNVHYDPVKRYSRDFKHVKVIHMDKQRQFQILSATAEMLTMKGDSKFNSIFNFRSIESGKYTGRLSTQMNLVKSFYIFCDVIEDQYLGSRKEKLLKIVKPEGQYSDIVYKDLTKPHYVKVNQNFINTIQIKITDENRDPINFSTVPVIIKLHFERNNEFLRNPSKRCVHEYLSAKRPSRLYNRPSNTSRTNRRKL